MRHAVVIAALISLLSTAAFGQAASPTFNQVTVRNGGIVISPPLHADGVTSDDAILKAAIDKCSSQQGTVQLPPGKILLTGAAGTISLHNCAMNGVGVLTGNGGIGTEIDLTSTTVTPFTIGSSWSISGVNFWWPNQTGAIVYPPLLQDAGVGATSGDWFMDNDTIINAYDGIVQTVGSAWGRFYIQGGNYYATHDLFRLDGTGDSTHITNIHMTPGPWLDRCPIPGGSACLAAIDAAATNNTILHVDGTFGVTITWNNSATFDWRYGIKIDSGGVVAQNDMSIDWDGMGTILDTSSGGRYPYQNTMRGSGTANCGSTYSYASNSNVSFHPCFNLGGNSSLNLSGGAWGSNSDFAILAAGANVYISNAGIFVGPGPGGSVDTYLIHALGSSQIYLDNVIGSGGPPGNTHSHGIVSTAATPTRLTVTNSQFDYFNEVIDTKTSPTTILTSDWSIGTAGANSVIFTDTNNPIIWANNQFDQPSSPIAFPQTTTNGNFTMFGGGYLDFASTGGQIGPPTTGTTSVGTRIRFFNNGGPPDYSFGIEPTNMWLALPGYSAHGNLAGSGIKFYGGSTNVATLDGSGSLFSYSVHAGYSLETGSAQLLTQGAVTSLDVPGQVVATVAINAAGSGFLGSDVLTDGFGGLYSVTVDGSGHLLTITQANVAGSTAGAVPCTTACALHGGMGAGATVNLTWTAGTTIAVGPTSATAVNIGRTGAATTVAGTLNLTGLPTTCSGHPTNSVASVAGVLTLCP